MAGGVSQMDSFEYKPVLNALHGKPIPQVPQVASGELQGKLTSHLSMASKWTIRIMVQQRCTSTLAALFLAVHQSVRGSNMGLAAS